MAVEQCQLLRAVGRIIGGVTSLVGLLLFGVLTSVITKALMGPVFGTETEKPVVEPDVFYFNPSNGTVGSSDTMATSNVDNLLSLGVIDAAEAERIGLVSICVDDDEVQDRARAVAEQRAGGAVENLGQAVGGNGGHGGPCASGDWRRQGR